MVRAGSGALSAGKLATIVAVDVAGYSALAQADEEGAVEAVARLDERAKQIAAEHAGRVFNISGDAVMMEFPTAAAGLAAAEALAAVQDPPIRVAVHMGEVSAMPNGDLLGHGVSVATRLQARATPGVVLVSEDARRALHGPLARRLVAKGVVKLDKIDESIAVFELSDDDGARPDFLHRQLRGARGVAIVGLALLAVAVFAALAWPLLRLEPPTRVAVFSQAATDDPALQSLASSVADDIALALAATHIETIARAETAAGAREQRLDRARALGAALALEGTAERDGDDIRLTLAVVRTSDRMTLWSKPLEGAAGAMESLRARAAERGADVMGCGVDVVRRRRAELDGATFSLLLQACDTLREGDRPLEARDAMTRVVEREPRFPFARALLALSGAMASMEAPEPMRTSLRDSARAEAERARRGDRSIGESYIALSLLEAPDNWEARENLLRQGLEHDEFNGALNGVYASLLLETGRATEALAFAQQGVALDPLSASKRRNLATLLLIAGDLDAARDIVEGMAPAWGDDPRHWQAQLRIAFWGGRHEDALALLAAPASEVRAPLARACWRQAAEALRRDAPAPQDARRVLECQRRGDLPADQAVMLLSALGDLDEAFALARTTFVDERRGGHDVLFMPAARAMRADPRFMQLARELGLLRYWRLTGRWPDFCREESLPYRCDAEAARLR